MSDVPYIHRWGSSAVLRYVQEAQFCCLKKAASAVAAHVSPTTTSLVSAGTQGVASVGQSPLPDLIRDAVEKAMQGSQLLVHNPRSKICHRPCPSERQLSGDKWVTFVREMVVRH